MELDLNNIRLSEAEEAVMLAVWKVWDGTDPVVTKDFFPLLADRGWTTSAMFTFVRRLEDKGFLLAKRSPYNRRENVYYPLVLQENWQYKQSVALIDNYFGDLATFLIQFVENAKSPAETLAQLIAVLDELKKRFNLY